MYKARYVKNKFVEVTKMSDKFVWFVSDGKTYKQNIVQFQNNFIQS